MGRGFGADSERVEGDVSFINMSVCQITIISSSLVFEEEGCEFWNPLDLEHVPHGNMSWGEMIKQVLNL